jgi:hypothetical protein
MMLSQKIGCNKLDCVVFSYLTPERTTLVPTEIDSFRADVDTAHRSLMVPDKQEKNCLKRINDDFVRLIYSGNVHGVDIIALR